MRSNGRAVGRHAGGEKGRESCSGPPIGGKTRTNTYRTETSRVNTSFKMRVRQTVPLYSQKVPVSVLVGAGGCGWAEVLLNLFVRYVAY